MVKTKLIEQVRTDNPPEGVVDSARRYTIIEAVKTLGEAVKSTTDEEYRRSICYAAHQVQRLLRELEEQPIFEPKTTKRHEEYV